MITSLTFDDISPDSISASRLKWLLRILDQAGIPSTFFVVAERQTGTAFDDEFVSVLMDASDFGHELALHGHRHVKNEFGYAYLARGTALSFSFLPLPQLGEQKKKLDQAITAFAHLTGKRPLGFRAPFYLYNNKTLEALSAMGFKYDSSKTVFKPSYGRRFRVRWSWRLRPQQIHHLIEIPVTGDYTFNLSAANFYSSLQRVLSDFEWTTSHEGVFVVNVHPSRCEEKLLAKFLNAVVGLLRRKTEFVRLLDVKLQ